MGALRRVVIVMCVAVAVRCTTSSPTPGEACNARSAPNAHFEWTDGCVGEYCAFSCSPGFIDCNEDESDGCEAREVFGGSHTRTLGRDAGCTVECESGWVDCDSNLEDGCEGVGGCYSFDATFIADASSD